MFVLLSPKRGNNRNNKGSSLVLHKPLLGVQFVETNDWGLCCYLLLVDKYDMYSSLASLVSSSRKSASQKSRIHMHSCKSAYGVWRWACGCSRGGQTLHRLKSMARIRVNMRVYEYLASYHCVDAAMLRTLACISRWWTERAQPWWIALQGTVWLFGGLGMDEGFCPCSRAGLALSMHSTGV